MRSPDSDPAPRLGLPALLAVLIGAAARVAALVTKPLWADETFTLWMARRSAGEILATLRDDSGPPLHYLVSRLVLLPFPGAGHGDIAVRLVSLVASLLHLPLLLAVGRKLGDPRLGARAAALFALFPLAIDFAAEGRAYALASLLALAALDRALALCERPRARDAVLLALAGGAAALTHYLAILPICALALLLPRANGRGALAAGLAGAGLLFSPWLPVALHQPRASMAWSAGTPPAETASRFLANLAFGVDPTGGWILPLAILGLATLGLALLRARTALATVPAVSPLLLGGVALLFLLQAVTGAALLPQRSALPFLPLACLVLAGARPPAGAALLVVLGAWVARLLAPPTVNPGTELARTLLPLARQGATVCAPGLWGPDLDYRLAAGGAPGRVLLFPSEVARHRGWFDDDDADPAALAVEAEALVSRPDAPRLWVIPTAGKAAGALGDALDGRSTRILGRAPLFTVVSLAPR